MAEKKTAKKTAKVIKPAAVKKDEQGTPVSGKSSNKVKILLKMPRDLAFNMADGRRIILRGSTFALRGKDTGILDFSKVQSNIIDAADWEYALHSRKEYIAKLMKNDLLKVEPVNVSEAQQKADEKYMQENAPKVGLESVDPKHTKTAPISADGE